MTKQGTQKRILEIPQEPNSPLPLLREGAGWGGLQTCMKIPGEKNAERPATRLSALSTDSGGVGGVGDGGWGVGACWGQSRPSDACFLPILSASKSLAGLGLPPDSRFSPPGASSTCWHGLGSGRSSPLLHWTHLGGPPRQRAVSPGTHWGNVSAYRTLGGSGAVRPDELAALTPSHRLLLSQHLSPWASFGRGGSGRAPAPSGHSRAWPGSGPYSPSETLEARPPPLGGSPYISLGQDTGIPDSGNLPVHPFTQQGLWDSRLFCLQLTPVSRSAAAPSLGEGWGRGYSATWRGSRQPERSRGEKRRTPESRRSTSRWDWGRKTRGTVGGAGLEEEAEPYVTPESQNPLPAGAFVLSRDQVGIHGPLTAPIRPRGVPWLQKPPKQRTGVGGVPGGFREGRPWPERVPQWVPLPPLCSQRPLSLGLAPPLLHALSQPPLLVQGLSHQGSLQTRLHPSILSLRVPSQHPSFQLCDPEPGLRRRDTPVPPAEPEAQLRPSGCSFSRPPARRTRPTSQKQAQHGTARRAREGAQRGHSNLWVGATRAAGWREGRGLALWACQLVHQLQLPLQGALDQQGYGVKHLSVLGRTSP